MPGLGAFGAAVVASPCFLPGVLLSSSKTSKSIIFPALPSAPRASAQHKINLVYSSTRNSHLSSRLPGWKETNFLLKHFPLDLLFSPRRKLRSGSCCCAVAAVLLVLGGQHGPGVPAQLGLLPAPCSHETWHTEEGNGFISHLAQLFFQASLVLLERFYLVRPGNKSRAVVGAELAGGVRSSQ